MSNSAPEFFVSQWADMIFPLAEQKGSRLRGLVDVKTGVVGKRKAFDRLGSSTAYTLTVRHGPTQLGNIAHSRRWANLVDKAAAEGLDEADSWKMLLDPKNEYNEKIKNALGRVIDSTLITAARGSATEGEEGTSQVALPAGQKIAHGGTGLTVAKLRQTARKLNEAEIETEGRVFVLNAKGQDDLLATTEVTSSDFNTVKTLVDGDITGKTFLGFTFVRTELLDTDGAQYFGLAFQRAQLGLAVGQDIAAKISQRDDLNLMWQVYARMSVGAVRKQDTGVVECAYVV